MSNKINNDRSINSKVGMIYVTVSLGWINVQ